MRKLEWPGKHRGVHELLKDLDSLGMVVHAFISEFKASLVYKSSSSTCRTRQR